MEQDEDCRATGGGAEAWIGLACIIGLLATGLLYVLYCAAQALAWL